MAIVLAQGLGSVSIKTQTFHTSGNLGYVPHSLLAWVAPPTYAHLRPQASEITAEGEAFREAAEDGVGKSWQSFPLLTRYPTPLPPFFHAHPLFPWLGSAEKACIVGISLEIFLSRCPKYLDLLGGEGREGTTEKRVKEGEKGTPAY